MEFIMAWKWWFVATVMVAVGIVVIAAIGHRRTQRLIAARTGGGAGGGGGGVNPQPSTPTGSWWEKVKHWLREQWTEKLGQIRDEHLWRNWLKFPIMMMVIIFITSRIILYFFPEPTVIFGTPIRPSWLAFLGLTAWLFSRKENIEPDQWGVKKFFGKIVQVVGEGPTLTPPWLFTLTRYPAMQFSIQIGEKETRPTLKLLEGLVSPVAIQQCYESLNEKLEVNFASPEQAKWTLDHLEDDALKDTATQAAMGTKIKVRRGEYGNDPINSRLTALMKVTLLVRIDKGDVRQFARTMVTPERAILELNELARAVVGRWCGKRTAAFVSRNLGLLGREILAGAEDLVGDSKSTPMWLSDGRLHEERTDERKSQVNKNPWGLNILKVEVRDLALPESVKTGIADAAKATADADAVTKRAEGERQKRIKEGQGAADARKEFLYAEAEGARKFGEICKNSPEALQLAVLKAQQSIAENAELILAPDADVLGLFAKGQRILSRGGAQQQNQPPKGGTP